MNLRAIEVLILDVDGVLTNGLVSAGTAERSRRLFHVHDGCTIKLWRRCGGKVAILSGRGGDDIMDRAKEIGIDRVMTNISNKLTAYEEVLTWSGCGDEAVGYVADDLPDLKPMARCGFPVAVANAVPTVKRAAQYVTRRRGGEGAVAEVVELLLRKRDQWNRSLLMEA